MIKIKKNKMTTRGVLYIGYKCNIKCKFCYYAHNEAKNWEAYDECRRTASLLKSRYKLQAVDITGGEPTIYPHIHELLRYCNEIDLSPTLITNGQLLANEDHVQKFKESKVSDFLVSVHGYGDSYKEITGSRFDRLVMALDNLVKYKIPFRTNTTITASSYKDLKKIAELAVSKGAKVINYISYNPSYDWATITTQDFQVKHSEVSPYIKEALDYCDLVGIEANVRYMPFCMLKGHEDKCYNFAQLPYDPGEWDYKGWYSTEFNCPSWKFPDEFYDNHSKENIYYIAARTQTNACYARSTKCNGCALQNLCDGLTGQYMQRFGDGELRPQKGEKINKPNHFIADRVKVLPTWK